MNNKECVVPVVMEKSENVVARNKKQQRTDTQILCTIARNAERKHKARTKTAEQNNNEQIADKNK